MGIPRPPTSPARTQAAGDGDVLAALLIRTRGGDAAAGQELIERCEPMVRAVARRYVSDAADVEDTMQDVWLALTEHAARITAPAALRGWLVRVTTRSAWRVARLRSRALPAADVGERPATDDTESEATTAINGAHVTKVLDTALGRLRNDDRRLLEMLCADERPDYRRVGGELGRPVGSIGPTRQRALSRLRDDRDLRALVEWIQAG